MLPNFEWYDNKVEIKHYNNMQDTKEFTPNEAC
jgi:hypothetical protein